MRFGIVRPVAKEGNSEGKKKPVFEPIGREKYHQIEDALGYKFKDLAVLEAALTHKSVQGGDARADYERLEFLGDAVLDLGIADLLLQKYTESKEGDLSKMRAALVNTSSLAEISRFLGLSPFIRLSRGELASGGSDRNSILADVFEAIMGAIYRESGFDVAYSVVKALFLNRIETVEPRDPKTELQEILHATGSQAPEYLLECVEGPEHAPNFVSVVKVDGQVVGRGIGPTKKASQQSAAAQALLRLRGGDDIDKKFMVSASTN